MVSVDEVGMLNFFTFFTSSLSLPNMFKFIFMLLDNRFKIRIKKVYGIEEDGEMRRKSNVCEKDLSVLCFDAGECRASMWSCGIKFVLKIISPTEPGT